MFITMEDNELKLEVMFNSNNYGQVGCNIKILDGVAVAVFSDRRLARDMYNIEKKLGINEVYFKERLNMLGTKYPNKTKEEIGKILTDKFEEHNHKIIKGVNNDK